MSGPVIDLAQYQTAVAEMGKPKNPTPVGTPGQPKDGPKPV